MPRSFDNITITDPRANPDKKLNGIESWLMNFIEDERDLPFIWLCLRITFLLFPSAVVIYWASLTGRFAWWMGPIHWALLFGLCFDRYILMLHNTSHRRFFKRKLGLANKYIPWVLGPMCGQAPETYYIHHMTVHHADGNMPKDLSTTMPFQRDSIVDFIRYFLRFFFLIIPDMWRYQAAKKRYNIVRTMLIGEVGFYVFCALMAMVSWQATLVVFITPWLLARFLMMAGNWGQHAFVNHEDPGDPYKGSITCINNGYNRRCFNDGYHISHHVVARRHWTEHPDNLIEDRELYIEADAIVFEKIDFFIVWALLMLKRYDTLANFFVEMRHEPRSHEEVVALLKRRTRRFEVSHPSMVEAAAA